jgi:hypothetical protein
MSDCYLTVVMTLRNLAVRQYQNFHFNSMAVFNGKYLALGPNGAFELETGDTDAGAPIDAFFEPVLSDWGIENEKRVRFMYVSARSDGKLKLTQIPDNGAAIEEEFTPAREDRQSYSRIPGWRNGRGAYWTFRLSNVDGSYFEVNKIEVLPIVLGKKPS